MREKELTYEEIVKDIERSTGMPSYWKKIVLALIKRQNAEIERLTEENEAYKEVKHIDIINELSKENAELQKQVDEVKATLYKSKQDMMVFHGSTIKQAVKDTAKEIYRKAEKKAYFKDGGHYDKDRYLLDMVGLKEIVKRYGVEVE